MLTSRIQRTSISLATVLALFGGAAGCGGADASNKTNTTSSAGSPTRISQLAPQDPPRPTTKEACDACQGLWDVHGVEPVETCICKTSDFGHDCLDGKDCQGECILDGDPEFHVMEQGDPPLGYYQGHCAPYDTTFGCFSRIPDDVATALPLAAAEAAQMICVD
jgi:hypothetical protein